MFRFSFVSMLPTIALYLLWKKYEYNKKMLNTIGTNNIKMLTVNLDSLISRPFIPTSNISKNKWIILNVEEHNNIKKYYVNNFNILKNKKKYTTEFISNRNYYALFNNITFEIYTKNIIDIIYQKYSTTEIVISNFNNHRLIDTNVFFDHTILKKKLIGKIYFNKGLMYGNNTNYILIGPTINSRFDLNNVIVEKNTTLEKIKDKYIFKSKLYKIMFDCAAICTVIFGVAGIMKCITK